MTDLLLTGARVLTPDEDLERAWVAIADGRIGAVGRATAAPERPTTKSAVSHAAPPLAAETVDLGGRLLAPGFLDLHVHGGGGSHFMAGDPAAAARFHARHGTTGLLATTLSAAPGALIAAVRGIARAVEREPVILGAHLEGPWLNAKRRGAQEAEHLRAPDLDELRALAAAGPVRMVSLAPELPGALELIGAVAAAGAVPALAHTDATYDQTAAAIAAGARHALHVFNGMRPLHHREPGVLGAVLDRDEITCEVIADGHHVHPAAIRILHRAKGTAGTVLVTDAIEAAGLPDGTYRLGSTAIDVSGGRAQTADGSLAGSTLTMDGAVRNAHRWLGTPLIEAVALATTTPARVLGLERPEGPDRPRLRCGSRRARRRSARGVDVRRGPAARLTLPDLPARGVAHEATRSLRLLRDVGLSIVRSRRTARPRAASAFGPVGGRNPRRTGGSTGGGKTRGVISQPRGYGRAWPPAARAGGSAPTAPG